MLIDLSSHRAEASFALGAAILVGLWRIYRFRSVDGDFLVGVFEALLGGALLPAAGVLISCPFSEKPPDLSRYQLYLLVSGIGLVYVAFIIIRRSLQPAPHESPPKS
jgi:hypothetical protein